MQEGNRARFGTTVLGRNPCDLILTGRKARKGEPTLNVRCWCMAPVGAPKYGPGGSFKYDILGPAHNVHEARVVWDEHVQARQREDAGIANLTQAGPTDIVDL